jgi:hypothetical protein
VQVVAALGPVGGPQPGGGFGFFKGLTSEDVDYKGVVNVIEVRSQDGPFPPHRSFSAP